MPLNVQIQVETPSGTGYTTTPGALKKLGARIVSPITWLADKVSSRVMPERRVKDAGQGDYRLYRRGEAGAVRLNVVAQLASAVRGSKDAAANAPAAAERPASIQPVAGSAMAPAVGSAAPTAEEAVEDFVASFKKAKAAISGLAKDAADLREKAGAEGITSKRGRRQDTQRRLKEVELEQAIVEQLGALQAVKEAVAGENLSEAKREAAETQFSAAKSFLFRQLVAVHLPGVAQHLERLEAASRTRDSARDLVNQIANETGQRAEQILSRNQVDDRAGDGNGADPDAPLDGFHGGFVDEVVDGLDRLYTAGVLKPALIRRLADVGPMRDWGGFAPAGNKGSQREALDKLDAAFAFRDMLKALADGNRVTINFLLGGDSRLDEDALRLKLEMNKGKPGFDEETVRLQHALDTAKRGLQELLKVRQEAWGKAGSDSDEVGRYRKDKVDTVINEGGSDQIRIDSRLIHALRNAVSKSDRTTVRADADAGRDVNMLVASVMLLQKRLDARGADEVATLKAARLEAAEQVLTAARGYEADKRLVGLRLDDAERTADQLNRGTLGENIGAIHRALQLSDRLALDRAAGARSPGHGLEVASQRAEAELEKELQWLRGMFGGKKPEFADLRRYAPLANGVAAYDRANSALAAAGQRAAADMKLGLDDKDLLTMGFDRNEAAALMADVATELHGTIGGIASQGLRNSREVKQVNEAVNKIVGRLLGKGMSQDTFSQLAGTFSEGRANLFLDIVFRGVSGQTGSDRLSADDDAVKKAFQTQVGAYLDEDGAESAEAAATVEKTSKKHQKMTLGIAEQAARLSRLDEEQKAARERLADLVGQLGLKVDTNDPKGFELAKTLLSAAQTDKILQKLEQVSDPPAEVQADIAEFSRKLSQDLAALRKLNPDTMRGSIFFGEGPRTRAALRRFATPERLEVAQHIVTVRSIPGEKTAVMRDIENRSAAADDILAARQDLMGESHAVLRNAIRAAVLDVRASLGTEIEEFDPSDFHDQIAARLQSWGIEPDRYEPEIADVLYRSLDDAELEQWIEDAKTGLGDAAFRELADPSKAARARRFLKRVVAFDNQKIDYVTRQTVIETVQAMKAGDKIYIAQGDSGTFYTGRVPVEKTGTFKVSAEIVVGERKLLEVQKTQEGLEVFFKAGLQGAVSAGGWAGVLGAADVGISGTASGNTLAGAGLRFVDEAALEDFLRKLLGGGRISPDAWSKADEAVLVTDRTLKLTGGIDLYASTTSLGSKLGWAKDFLALSTDVLGAGEAQLFAGLEAQVDAGWERRWTEEENVERRVIEKETVYEAGAGFRLGAYALLPTSGDFLLDQEVARRTPLKQDPRDPFTANFYTPLAVGKSKRHSHGVVRRLAYRRDGLLDASGNEIAKVYSAQGALSLSDLGYLMPNFARGEIAAGAKDSLLQALGDNRNGFKDEVVALLGSAEKDDRVAVTYALRDEIRTVVDDNLREVGRLRRDAAAARGRGDEGAARRLEGAAATRESMAERLYQEESSYTASRVQLVKNGSVNKDLRVIGLRTLNWGRYGEGGTERPAITINVPGGPAERDEAEDKG